MKRVRRKRPSNPRIVAEGWENKDPTEVIDLALERVKRGAVEAESKLRQSRRSLAKTSREFHLDLESAIRATSDFPKKERTAG